MATPNPYRQYQDTQVQTAGPAQLTLMCFDGAIRFLNRAQAAMEANNFYEQNAAIGRAQALLNELLKGLDFNQGGEIARNLEAIYTYLYDRLTQANLKDDIAALDEVRGTLAELRTTWAEAITLAGNTASAAPQVRREFALSV